MCIGSTPKAPPAAAVLPEAAQAPVAPSGAEAGGAAARDRRRRAAAAGEGSASTILTGPRGVQDGATTAGKTLLGQ